MVLVFWITLYLMKVKYNLQKGLKRRKTDCTLAKGDYTIKGEIVEKKISIEMIGVNCRSNIRYVGLPTLTVV